MTEVYKKWNLIEEDTNNFQTESIHDDYEGFRIIIRSFSPTDIVFKISVDAPVLYRNIDEGDRLKSLNEQEMLSRYSFLKVENSSLIKWLINETLEIKKEEDLNHYVIASKNDVIDIICYEEPKIEKL